MWRRGENPSPRTIDTLEKETGEALNSLFSAEWLHFLASLNMSGRELEILRYLYIVYLIGHGVSSQKLRVSGLHNNLPPPVYKL
jgi:hypothetical protein